MSPRVASRHVASRHFTSRYITEDSTRRLVIECRSADLGGREILAKICWSFCLGIRVWDSRPGTVRIPGMKPATPLRRHETVDRRPGRHVSRVLDVQVDVLLRLTEEVVYLLHGAERTDLLLGAVSDESPGAARRSSAIIDDVRVAVGVDRARPRIRRSQQSPAIVEGIRGLSATISRGFQIRVFEVYIGITFGVYREPSAALLSDREPRHPDSVRCSFRTRRRSSGRGA